MDSILLLGPKDERLERLLSKMGYDLVVGDPSSQITPLITGGLLDLIILDTSLDNKVALDIFEYLRLDDATKKVPMIVIAHGQEELHNIEQFGFNEVECVSAPYSAGSLVSKVATQLRLRKLKGAQDSSANLAEMNASLRDLNRKLQKDLEEARSIQQGLLSADMPQSEYFDVAVRYSPLEEVGGDWYTVHKTKGEKLQMMIADVTGHGLSAAFIGSMTKLALTAANEESPAPLLTRMNALMTPQLPAGRFVTMAAALYDPEHGELEVARAGHPPLLVYPAKKQEVRKVGGEGFALGFFDDSQYLSEKVSIEINDIVVLLTDGITEAQSRGQEMFGTDRVSEIVRSCPETATAQDIIDALLAGLEKFCDGRIMKDDVTVVVMKRKS